MSTINESSMRKGIVVLGVLAAATTAGCTELKVKNKAPVAAISLTAPETPDGTRYATRTPTGFPNPITQLPLFAGNPVSITLSAVGSTDPDGRIVSYRWMRTGRGRSVRIQR